MYDMVFIESVIGGGFIIWLSGFASGAIFRFVRNLILTSSR